MRIKSLNIIIIILLATLIGQSQVFPEKGVPLLKNYSPAQYLNSGKVWDISTSPNHLVYMASDNGLLEYDGKSWKKFTGSKGVTRSLLIINDSLIFTGSDLDFGVWKKSRYNNFDYKSLYPFKNEVQDVFEEFWNIYNYNETVVFVSSQNIYLYKNEQITKIKSQINISNSFINNDTIYFVDKESGLYYFDNLEIKQIIKSSDNISFIGLFNQVDQSILVSKNSGLFSYIKGEINPINNNLSSVLQDAKVFSFEYIDSSYLAFGTILKGLIITDIKGNIIHHITKAKGLYSNTILSLDYNKSGKLWIGMDYGVSSLYLHNNITYFYDFLGNFGTGSAATLLGNEFYLGTNQGLYHSSWCDLNDNQKFTNLKLIPGTEGQVWTVLNYDNKLFIGHDHGLYQLKEKEFIEINNQAGVWSILPYKDYLITGTYNGIYIYKNINNKWEFYKKLDQISGSCNQLILKDEHDLWINIPNYGVIWAVLDEELNLNNRKIFTTDNFDNSNLYITKDKNDIQIITENSQYVFDVEMGEFILSETDLLIAKPENIIPGIYKSSYINSNYAFYPIYNGFALAYKADSLRHRASCNPLVRSVKAYNNEEEKDVCFDTEITYKLNNISIEYVVPNQANVLYQYKLNADDDWSKWTSEHIVEYVGLKYGDYKFQLRSKIDNNISDILEFNFTIAKPWRLSWQAYILYFLIFVILVSISILRQKHILKKEKHKMLINEQNSLKKLTEQHKIELNNIEQERIKNEFELLKQQMRSKTIELANKSKESEDKNRLLISIQEKFVEMNDKPTTSKSKLNEIRRILNSYINVEDHTFEIQMDELHQDFFKNLKSKFPKLTNNDLRLCAYIKVGLNAKEIAEILNIQPSSSYISRSRLRKKLNLKTEDDLFVFLNNY